MQQWLACGPVVAGKTFNVKVKCVVTHAMHAAVALRGSSAELKLQAKPSMTKSSVVDNQTGKSMDSTVRTSTGTFFARGQDDVLASVEKRIAQARITNVPSLSPCLFVQHQHRSCVSTYLVSTLIVCCQNNLHLSPMLDISASVVAFMLSLKHLCGQFGHLHFSVC